MMLPLMLVFCVMGALECMLSFPSALTEKLAISLLSFVMTEEMQKYLPIEAGNPSPTIISSYPLTASRWPAIVTTQMLSIML